MIGKIFYVLIGYLVYKIVKNGAYLALDNLKKDKKLSESTELIKCIQCDSFVSVNIAVKHNHLHFCSENCREIYKNQVNN